MKFLSRAILVLFVVTTCLGFRVIPSRWDIEKSDPTLWIKVCAENDAPIETNDIDGGDSLQGVSNLTFAQVLQSVVDDYNNIQTSFLRLALYPADPNNPGAPASGDSTFTIAKAETRTIEICFGSTDPAAGVAGGYAKPEIDGNQLVGCVIEAKPEHAKEARRLTRLLAHELGHCFGLMHPQDGTDSLMTYFGSDQFRAQNDDMAGMTFLYPEESAYGKENITFGLTGCSPK